MSEANATVEPKASAKPKRERSPSFPFIGLPTAIKRLIEFEDYFKRHPTPAKHSGKAWGMKGWTSQAQQTLAALKAYGMIDYKGAGENLEASVTDAGRTYLRAQQEETRGDTVKRFALTPKAFSRHFEQWGSNRPPDAVCLDQLVLKEGYTDSAAKLFLSVYDSTAAYANLGGSDKNAPSNSNGLVEENDSPLPSEAEIESKRGNAADVPVPPPLPLDDLRSEWREERLLDESGDEIFIRYKGVPSKERYEFIRDYSDFKVKRMK